MLDTFCQFVNGQRDALGHRGYSLYKLPMDGMWYKIHMLRKVRIDALVLLQHVIIRGIEHRKIFKDNKDRDNFLDRLSDLLPATKTACYAWALLSNHSWICCEKRGKDIKRQ